jgi:hypothetical protein
MSSFMAFRSRWMSLAECSCSIFTLVVSCLCQVMIFLFLVATPTRAVSERSRLMRVEFPTGTRMRWSSEEAHSLLG